MGSVNYLMVYVFTVFRDRIGKYSYFSHGPLVQRGFGHWFNVCICIYNPKMVSRHQRFHPKIIQAPVCPLAMGMGSNPIKTQFIPFYRFSLFEKIWKQLEWQSVPTYLANHSKHSSRLSRWLSEEPRLQCCKFPTWGLCHQSLPNTNPRAWMEVWLNPWL